MTRVFLAGRGSLSDLLSLELNADQEPGAVGGSGVELQENKGRDSLKATTLVTAPIFAVSPALEGPGVHSAPFPRGLTITSTPVLEGPVDASTFLITTSPSSCRQDGHNKTSTPVPEDQTNASTSVLEGLVDDLTLAPVLVMTSSQTSRSQAGFSSKVSKEFLSQRLLQHFPLLLQSLPVVCGSHDYLCAAISTRAHS
ncbi:hypothetical protein CRENBAI_001306 [Crenichthys baileyi]|uniref:Uncharacterized protein n=1 Tax=Crenichthys baileyi TaxID=28760 RepID=A0AAV9RHA9_9TELE